MAKTSRVLRSQIPDNAIRPNPHAPVQRAVSDGPGEVLKLGLVRRFEIGDGAGDARDVLGRPRLIVENPFAHDRIVAQAVERYLLAAQKQPQGNRQDEAAGDILEVGRREVAKRSSQ